jgi:two-component system, chemotaxis family, CheB/CheR fusion protein
MRDDGMYLPSTGSSMATRKPSSGTPAETPSRALKKSLQQATPAGADKEDLLASGIAGFPIVGIGASAGGLEAFEQFFRACPPDTGMAFVLVSHLDPSHESLLTEILQRFTAMPVMQVQDKTRVKPNRVYVIPPDREMNILGGALQLSMPNQERGQRMPIDAFLRSLADEQGGRAIGIVLSGTGSDGTLGLRAILGAGGICMVQDPSTAKFDSMPRSAITAGYTTHILPVEEMPAMLKLVASQAAFRLAAPALVSDKAISDLNQVLLQLRASTGHDFSLYKKSTIGRRIERRMANHHIDSTSVYARYLKDNPAEAKALFRELLINVTSFFRDPEAFEVLKNTILPPLLAGKPQGYVFRVWVAGCASGEEAYSIAIVLRELMGEIRARDEQELAIQIYATDLDDEAIALARSGRYPPNIAQDITPERLHRFFIKDEAGYKVTPSIREMVVFAVQNVAKDPAFTKLDLLSCRNLLIYLEPALQDRLILSFHYALKPDGVLLLSASESITKHPDLFAALDRNWKFFQAKHAAAVPYPGNVEKWALMTNKSLPGAGAIAIDRPNAASAGSIGELSHHALLKIYAPASVTTDVKGNILFVYGDTGKYLRPAPGPVSNNVIDMAREGLQLELRKAILGAVAQAAPVLNQHVLVKTDDDFFPIGFSVHLLSGQRAGAVTESGEPLLLLSFWEAAETELTKKRTNKPAVGKRLTSDRSRSTDVDRIGMLERELAYARESLQATIEEQHATNEELKSTNEELQSANEELQSSNEELQSSNEELETSKEELQSLSEEAYTVNGELSAKVEQLSGIHNDMKNLLDSVNTGTLFLDHHLMIRRYTPQAVNVYRLIATDVGRPLGDITSNIQGEDLLVELQTVLDTLIPREREVRTVDGAWYLASMKPYRTLDNIIAGAVLTFTNVTEFKLASIKLGEADEARARLAEGIVNTVVEPLIVLDGSLKVISANRSFYEHFQVKEKETVGRKIYALGNGQWDIPALRQLLEDILPREQVIERYEVTHAFPLLGSRRMVLNARRIVTTAGNTDLILVAMVEIEQVVSP